MNTVVQLRRSRSEKPTVQAARLSRSIGRKTSRLPLCSSSEAEALAEAAQDQLVKEVYLEVAQLWRELADRERNNW